MIGYLLQTIVGFVSLCIVAHGQWTVIKSLSDTKLDHKPRIRRAFQVWDVVMFTIGLVLMTWAGTMFIEGLQHCLGDK